MARYDKYDPMVGGFRAPLAADWEKGDVDALVGVGLNSQGQVVKGDGQSGVVGVLVLTKVRKAGEIVDVMTSGEVIEFSGSAGTVYTAAGADGAVAALTDPATAGTYRVGNTVEADRLVVRFDGGALA